MLTKKIKVAFINPPHADWCLANFSSFMMFKSHYMRYGKYNEQVEWLIPVYKYNQYASVEDIYEDVKDADIILFSCYVWNYDVCDQIAELTKQKNPKTICVLGGPHVGTNEPEFLKSRSYYDFTLKPTKPGENFVAELLDSYIDNQGIPNINDLSWELRSSKTCPQFMPDYSIYEDHEDLMVMMREYAKDQHLEPFMIIETTRGCPYQCAFCEWGGGIGGKVYKKPMEIVKKDILALKRTGYRDVYLTDANFGAFYDRDLEIFQFAWDNGINLTDISTMKAKDLKRRKDLVDAWFSVVGAGPETHSEVTTRKEAGHILAAGAVEMAELSDAPSYISIVPTVSFQSISDEAMKIAKRVDLSLEDKIELSRHIHNKCHQEGYPVPAIELILGMPGSNKDHFYGELELLWNFKSWTSFRHDYMFLPDSDLTKPEYLKKYDIKLVEVYTDLIDEEGVDNKNSFYRNKRNYFKTISSCYSFTLEDMAEMWIMNIAGNYLLKHMYEKFESDITAAEFGKLSFKAMKNIDSFNIIWEEIIDILNPNTPPRNSKRLHGRLRNLVIHDFIEENKILIYNDIFITLNT